MALVDVLRRLELGAEPVSRRRFGPGRPQHPQARPLPPVDGIGRAQPFALGVAHMALGAAGALEQAVDRREV